MSAAVARCEAGCASNLAMDRWLMGELARTEEGERLEAHVRDCSRCAARLAALRSLNGPVPPRPALEPPPLNVPPPVMPPERAAVLQVAISRDGLPVGTEMFTAGRYTVGSDGACGLVLEGLAPVHAIVSLSGWRVALEAVSGSIVVNGFWVKACELRAIDEVRLGPYTLGVRVIAERWHRPRLELVRGD